MQHNKEIGNASLNLLTHEKEEDLLRSISSYPEILITAARTRSPHTLANYLREVAQNYHSFYDQCHIVNIEDENLRNARMNLSLATKSIIADGLSLLGASAPESMFSEDKDNN